MIREAKGPLAVFRGTRLPLVFAVKLATFLPVLPMTSLSSVPRRILLVDDEPIVLDSIRRVLQFDGHRVAVAASGEEALTLLQESNFDLVVTDYEMPVMKGDKLAAAIKAIVPLQPILLVSAYGEQLRTARNPLSAVDAIIAKPFQMGELRQAIANLTVTTGSIVSARSGPDAAQHRLQS